MARIAFSRQSFFAFALVVVGINLEAVPSEARGDAAFGGAIAVADDLMVVGAHNQADVGAAYLFRRSNGRWGLVQRLAASQSSTSGFAESVAIDGKLVVAGNMFQNAGSAQHVGTAYVFEARGATFPELETQILLPPQPRRLSRFGQSVAVNGGTIAVGAPSDGNGAVYLFRKRKNLWANSGKLTGMLDPKDIVGAQFGVRVAVNDKFLVVIASTQKVPGHDRAGAIYIYRRADDGSVVEPPQMLTPPGQGVGEFMAAIALRDTEILVGASGIHDGQKRNAGGALLYSAGVDGKFPAEPTAMYVAPDAEANEGVVAAVALTADNAFVGSPLMGKSRGGVYIFPRNAPGSNSARRIEYPPAPTGGKAVGGNPAGGGLSGNFGGALAASNRELLVGAYALDNDGRVVPYTLDKSGEWKPDAPLSVNSPPPQRSPPPKRVKKS